MADPHHLLLDPSVLERFAAPTVDDDELDEDGPPVGYDAHVVPLIERLPPIEQDIVEMVIGARKCQRDVGAILGMTQANVSWRLHRAIERLRFWLAAPSFTATKLRRRLPQVLVNPLDVYVLFELARTTSQAETARVVGVSQASVGRCFARSLPLLQRAAERHPRRWEPVARLFGMLRGQWGISGEPSAEGTDRSNGIGSMPLWAAEGMTRQYRRIADLKPNAQNAELFSTSLAPESIATLAADMARNGQRMPVEIAGDGTILDGERRWRAAKSLGWSEVAVVVVAEALTEEQIESYLVDAFTSIRQVTIAERCRVYHAAFRVLQRRHGRAKCGAVPKGETPPEWTSSRVRAEAARLAGLGTDETARRAQLVLQSANEGVVRLMERGELSITAAFERIRHRLEAADQAEADGSGDSDEAEDTSPTDPAPQSYVPPAENPSPAGRDFAGETEAAASVLERHLRAWATEDPGAAMHWLGEYVGRIRGAIA